MTLKRLAEHLGLSQTTVSRALNGYPEVSETTRIRVREAATKFRYRPNPIASRLATGRSRAIGHVIPVSTRHEMVNPIFADFLAAAGECYSRRGYQMLLSVVSDDEVEFAYQTMAEQGMVDGILVQGPNVSEPRIGILENVGLPFVVHGRSSVESRHYSWLDVNNLRAFKRATQLLIDSGHKRIGLINGLERMDFAYRRRQGYEEALISNGLTVDPDIIRSDDMTEQYGYEATQELLNLDNPPSALLISSILSAIGARNAIQQLGHRMGEDISVMIHDDELSYLKNAGPVPAFTAMRSSIKEAGKRCAEILLDKIENPERPHFQELWEAELVIGSSAILKPSNDP